MKNNKLNVGIVPKLRFPDYKDKEAWEIKTLCSLAERKTDRNNNGKTTRVLTNSATNGVIDQRDFFEKDIANQNNLDNYLILDTGDYVYNPRISITAPVGPISKNKLGKGVMSPLYTVFRFYSQNNDFYEHYFKTNCWHKYLYDISNTGARHDRMSISNDDFMNMPLPYPTPDEQQKIADCLTSLDNFIYAENQKLKTLKNHKKGLMQNLFPRESEEAPRLRFPQFQNTSVWSKRNFAAILKEHKSKSTGTEEVFSVSVHKGLINQVEHLGRSYAAATTDHYNRVYPGDIVYTKSPTGDFPLGVIKQSKIEYPVIVSPLYGVFTPETSALGTILDAYFESPINVNNYLASIVKKGAKNTINITNTTFLSKALILPTDKDEQRKIADCLSSLDSLITAQSQKIDTLKSHKKGLMQQLFPSANEVSE